MSRPDKERADKIDSKALFRIGKKDKEGRPSIYWNGQAIATVAFMQASLDQYFINIATTPDLLAALKAAADALSGTLKTRACVIGSDISGWAPEVQAEVRAFVAIRTAIVKIEGREVGA